MGVFKTEVISFKGGHDDLVWVYDASNDKNIVLVAEPPHEVVHILNGATVGVYSNQRIDHKYQKSSLSKYYFINTKMPCQTPWGTSSRLEYKDAQSGRIVSIGANGIISFHISDGRKFIEKVLGSRSRYNTETLVQEMLPKIFDEFAEHLLWAITSENISYEMLDLKLKEIGSKLLPKLNYSLDKYGIYSEEFIIRQFIKAGELKERLNEKVIKTEQYDDIMLDADRKLELLKKQEMLEQQHMKMEQSRNQHGIDIEKSAAQLEADIEKMSYDAKGASYKELHEMKLDEIKTIADGEAKIAEAKKVENDTIVVIKKENTGKCPHCDGEISADQIFCPTCKKKII